MRRGTLPQTLFQLLTRKTVLITNSKNIAPQCYCHLPRDLIKSNTTSLFPQISIHLFSQTIKGLITVLLISPIIHLVPLPPPPPPPPRCIFMRIVFYCSWNHCNIQESSKTRVMQSFLRQTKCIMGDGRCAIGE